MVACWAEDPNGEAFKKHLARVPDYLWVSEDGMTMQVKFNNYEYLNHNNSYLPCFSYAKFLYFDMTLLLLINI